MHLIWFDPPYPLVQDEAERARIVDAFRAVAVEKLDETGFAMLRVPWPLKDVDDASWELEGLDGPEIRTYRGMAVLWYMRARADGDGAES